jgi:hypothetical protein
VAKDNVQTLLPRATIWSALFLGVYVMISSASMSNWLKHCHGVAAIVILSEYSIVQRYENTGIGKTNINVPKGNQSFE